MTLEELQKKHRELENRTDKNMIAAISVAEESRRVAEVAANTSTILGELDREFESITKLDAKDVGFLFLAIALQVARQYLVTKFPERLDDQTAAKKTKGHFEEHSDRMHRYYNPSLEEICSNPVPFDANIGANGALKGGGVLGHRVKALGHDPIVGLVVGTCNIATSTLTTNTLESFHIHTNINGRDAFRNRANTALVFEKSVDKLIDQGARGKAIIGASLIKEIIHLRSDVHTKNSLPLPVISMIDGELASRLAEYGLDMSNVITVTKQATCSVLINTLIAMIHGLLAPEEMNSRLYEVKTRRILSYSNAIATYSNVLYVATNAALGNEGALNDLDVGGLLVTCYRVATDAKFISDVKKEFIEREFFSMINGDV